MKGASRRGRTIVMYRPQASGGAPFCACSRCGARHVAVYARAFIRLFSSSSDPSIQPFLLPSSISKESRPKTMLLSARVKAL